jgi:hypothetical protein
MMSSCVVITVVYMFSSLGSVHRITCMYIISIRGASGCRHGDSSVHIVWNRTIVNRHSGNRINTGETGKHRQGLRDSRLISRRTRSKRGTVSYQGAPFICTPSTLDPLARVSCFSEQFPRPLIYLELPLQTPHLFPLCTAKMPTTNDQFDKSFLDADINQLVKQLTMDEKVSLLAGSGWWETVSVPRKNIPR